MNHLRRTKLVYAEMAGRVQLRVGGGVYRSGVADVSICPECCDSLRRRQRRRRPLVARTVPRWGSGGVRRTGAAVRPAGVRAVPAPAEHGCPRWYHCEEVEITAPAGGRTVQLGRAVRLHPRMETADHRPRHPRTGVGGRATADGGLGRPGITVAGCGRHLGRRWPGRVPIRGRCSSSSAWCAGCRG